MEQATDIYKRLSSTESDDIDVLKLLVGAAVKIFWAKPELGPLDYTLKYKVPFKDRCFGSILLGIETLYTYRESSLDDFCMEFSLLNGPDLKAQEALIALRKFIPSLKVDVPTSRHIHLEAYCTTYFYLSLHEHADILRQRSGLG